MRFRIKENWKDDLKNFIPVSTLKIEKFEKNYIIYLLYTNEHWNYHLMESKIKPPFYIMEREFENNKYIRTFSFNELVLCKIFVLDVVNKYFSNKIEITNKKSLFFNIS